MRRQLDALIFAVSGLFILVTTFTAGDGGWTTGLAGLGLLVYAGYIAMSQGAYWVSYQLYALLLFGVVLAVALTAGQ